MTRTKRIFLLAGLAGLGGCMGPITLEPVDRFSQGDTATSQPPVPENPRPPRLSPEWVLTARPGGAR